VLVFDSIGEPVVLEICSMSNDFDNRYALYFAYGSNMLEQRLKDRVKSAEFLSNAWVRGYEVRFRKISIDDSGKVDLVHTGEPSDIVHGVVYQFDPEEWSALDAAESGYDRTPIQVHTDSGTRDVTTYLARRGRIDESLKPYTWYLQLIRCGAEQHGLPEDYRQKIENTLAIPDPVENRGAKRDAETQIEEYRKSRGSVSKDRS
jgi:gamma-glutamylcyclotransferase